MPWWDRQLNEMRTKLEQLKQLEATYTEMQMLHDSVQPGNLPRPMAEDGPWSQSPPSRTNEAVGSGGWIHEPSAEVAESVDEVEDESSVPPSPAPPPPPRPRPPKNYRYVRLSLFPVFTSTFEVTWEGETVLDL